MSELSNDADYSTNSYVDSSVQNVVNTFEPRISQIEEFFAVVENPDEIIDTLAEIQAYISEDVESAAQMLHAIDQLNARIDALPIPKKVSELENDKEYLTPTSLDNYYNKEDILKLLQNIEFIDGGKAPVVII